jgi:RNA polymerase sigma-70 factor (ECF subfamily)
MSKWLLSDGRPDFELLFAEARPQLLAVARRVVRNEDDAEDVLQNAFENAIKYGDRFEARAQATSWMYRIVYNTGLMHLRSRKRKGAESLDALPAEVGEAVINAQGHHMSSPPAPDSQLERGAIASLLGAALSKLSPLDRDIVRMRLQEDRSTAQVAAALGLSPAATKTRLHRARLALQQLVGDSAMELVRA